MRSIICAVSLTVLLLALGCNHIMPNGNGGNKIVKNDKQIPMPTVEKLVKYLNDNAKSVPPGQALKSNNVTINVVAEGRQVGIEAKMQCQAPRNFRLSGVLMGNPMVDVGSNDNEFWFWCKQLVDRAGNPPYLYHCSYQALAGGNVKVPFPFQPDMVLNALGLTPYDPAKKYTVQITPPDKGGRKFIELAEQARSLDNKPIQKVTVFHFNEVQPPQPQVVAHILKDERGKVICAASIRFAQQVGGKGGPIIPQMIDFNWPEQKTKMTMTIYNPEFVPMPPERAAMVFTRQNLTYQSFDLATQALDGAGVQQAGATGTIYRR